ncbi:MAG TPA: YCF48-related protein [Ktedonobacteraceae bacterium]
MKDKQVFHTRYADLFSKDETIDPALEHLIADLETVYPPAPYPASLPARLISALETHIERSEQTLTERTWTDTLELPHLPAHQSQHEARGWRHRLGTLVAAVLTILLISSLLLVLYKSHQAGTPGANNTSAPQTLPEDIFMMNTTDGWAQLQAGNNPLLRTSDGGVHWRHVTPAALVTSGYGASAGIYASSANSAWVSGESKKQQHLLFHTTDGGQSWQSVALPAALAKPASFPGHTLVVHFLNAQLGMIGQISPQAFWYTTNGGLSWRSITSPSVATQYGWPTLFDEKTWIFTTGPGARKTVVNGQPTIYVTHNAGTTWHAQILPVPAGFSFSGPMESVQSFSATDGLLSVADGGADILFYSTHDGGDSWQVTAPLSPEIIHRLYEFGLPSFSSMNDGQFFLAPIPEYGKLPAPNYLIITHDGGQHWQVITVQLPLIKQKQPGAQGRAYSIAQFSSPQVGWLLVNYAPSRPDLPRSGLYKTVDGGHTWTAIAYQIAHP